MKLKHISALLLFLFVFSFAGFSQVEDEEVQMFSFNGTRGIGAQNVHNFGTVDKIATYKIELENTGATELKIGKITIPEGVGVVVLKEVLNKGEKGGIIVTIDPQYFEAGDFTKKLVISTVTVNDKGVMITKTAAYELKGKISK